MEANLTQGNTLPSENGLLSSIIEISYFLFIKTGFLYSLPCEAQQNRPEITFHKKGGR